MQRDAERGTKVIAEVIDMITGTKLDTGTYLDKLKRLSHDCPGTVLGQFGTIRITVLKPSI